MAPWKAPLAVVEPPRRDPEPPVPYVSYQDDFDNETRQGDRRRSLADQLQERESLDRFLGLLDFVTDAHPVVGRRTAVIPGAEASYIPERGAVAGRRGAGDRQHPLQLVGGQLIDATDRFAARRRNHLNNSGSAA